jgi:hypothetical protein
LPFRFIKRVMERKIKRVIKFSIFVCLVLITGYFILNAVIRRQIGQQLINLSPSLTINFSDTHVNLLSSFVSFDSLDIQFVPYNNRQDKHHLYFSTVSLNGISFLKFLFGRNLEVTNLLLDNGNLQLDSFLLDKKDSAQSKILNEIKWPFKKFYVGNMELKNARVLLHSENSDQQIARVNMRCKGISIGKPGEKPSIDDIDLRLSDITYRSPGYVIRVPELTINSSKKILESDSLHVSAIGKDQNEITISALRMTGFDVMKLLDEKILVAKTLTVDKGKVVVDKNGRSKIPTLPFDLKKIEIDNVEGKDLSVAYKDKLNECHFTADIVLNKADVDPSFDINKTKFGSVHGNVRVFHYSGNNYHDVELKSINISSSKELIQITGINIKPRIGKYEFGKKLGHQADWMQAYISKVDVIRPDFDNLLRQNYLPTK